LQALAEDKSTLRCGRNTKVMSIGAMKQIEYRIREVTVAALTKEVVGRR